MANPVLWTQTGVAAIQNLLFAGVAGSVLCESALQRVFASSRDAARLRLRGSLKQSTPGTALPRARWFALGALGLLHLLYLWLQAATMSGSGLFDALRVVRLVLGQSHYGRVWLVSLVGLVIALVAARRMMRTGGVGGRGRQGTAVTRPRRAATSFIVLGLALYAAGRVGASHAADAGDFSLAEWVHWIHLGATASWAGSVFAAAAVLPTFALATRADSGRHLAFCDRLSRTSAVALVLVIVTGLYNSLQIGAHATQPLLDAPYGQALGMKLGFAVFALLLGAINRTVWLPRLRDAQRMQQGGNALPDGYAAAARKLGRTLSIESLLLAITLIAAAVLAHMTPAG
jgi:copper resistance protein D